MPLNWTKPAQGSQLLSLLDELTGLNKEGNVTLGGGGSFDIYIDILAGCIDFSKYVPTAKRVEITRRAVIDAKRSGAIKATAVLTSMHEAQNAYLRQPMQDYVLLSSISVKHGEHLRSRRLGGSSIRFTARRPPHFTLPLGGSIRVKDDTPRDYSYVKVHVTARDPLQAGDLAFDTIDELRAIWNLTLNNRTIERRSSGAKGYDPVNKILLGPFHTLHHPNGTPAVQRWWSSFLPKPLSAYDLSADMEQLKRDEAIVRRQLRRCTFPETLAGYIRQYGRALDESELHNSLLRLWAVLEQMTGPIKGNYDALIKRTSFLWDNYAEARMVLTYLRDHRNELVHAGSNPPDIERLVYSLKEYVEVVLKFLIHQANRFSSMQEIWSFLDLPPDVGDLRNRLGHHRRAIAFRS